MKTYTRKDIPKPKVHNGEVICAYHGEPFTKHTWEHKGLCSPGIYEYYKCSNGCRLSPQMVQEILDGKWKAP